MWVDYIHLKDYLLPPKLGGGGEGLAFFEDCICVSACGHTGRYTHSAMLGFLSMASWRPVLYKSPYTLPHPLHRSQPAVGLHKVAAVLQPPSDGIEMGVVHEVSEYIWRLGIAGFQLKVPLFSTFQYCMHLLLGGG